MRAVLLGKSMIGMRVQDALAVYDFAHAQPAIAADRISVVGYGNMGVVALHAGALEPRIARAVADGTVLSYLDLVRAQQLPEIFVDVIVPGVLQDFDLPDLAAQAGGQVVLSNPVAVDGSAVTAAAARAIYGSQVKVVLGDSPLPDLLQE
jgi:cephalosporin-C deacetylase-like acetyl esterase